MKIRSLVFLPFALLLAQCTTTPAATPTDDAADAVAADVLDENVQFDAGPDVYFQSDASPDVAVAPPGNATFTVQGSVEQVFVTHAAVGQALDLREEKSGTSVASGVADHLGSYVFRKIAAGQYRVFIPGPKPELYSDQVTVVAAEKSLPPQTFYSSQTITAGNGYIKTRDGTTLAYFATLPGPAEGGPYPTIVNYSGYDPGRPGHALVSGDQASMCDVVPVLCNAPSDASAMIAAVAGYATVSVNIRGTGCSGGAYDYFETLQLLDGYDIIETVAAQPWVMHHKVGMTGLSYPGITQLFVAKTQPPSLAAITPLSVIGNTATTLVPGGILNSGFALNWINMVYVKAAPYGQGWEQARVDGGDLVCKENQLLHDQRVNNVEQAKDVKYYDSAIITPLNPTAWVNQINVPVFLAGAWQDEQTGPFFVTLLDKFTAAPNKRFVVYNGVHPDGFAPQVLGEWLAFLDIYVAQQKPVQPAFMALLATQLTQQVYGVAVPMPADRWTAFKGYEDAKAEWEKEPELEAFFENGATDPLGAPHGHFSVPFTTWPPAETKAMRWYFQADGSLLPTQPTETAAASTFMLDPTAGDRGNGAKDLWSAKATYTWKKPDAGFEVAFVSEPLTDDLVMMGTGSVDLWVRSLAADVTDADIEVNLSEIRADGQERYVQSGWLRASFRKLAADATELWPMPSLVYVDTAPLVVGQWEKVRVAIAGFGHPFRKGSRIRIAIDTPGDSRADWRFSLLPFPHPVTYDVAHTVAYPSSVALPVLTGVTIPQDAQPLPACPSLRGQPCRANTSVPNVKASW